jgi:hypothetical protein
MTKENQMSNLKTPKFIVSYPSVFEPKKNDQNGKLEYSLCAIFPKGADLSALEKAVTKLLESKFGVDRSKWPRPLKSPFRKHEDRMKVDDKGNEYFPVPYEAGGIFMNLKSKFKPGLVDQQVRPITDQSSFYPGCVAIATLGEPYYYEHQGNKGIAFGLNNIQKVADGAPLVSRVKVEDEFSPVEGAGSSDTDGLFN